MIDLYLLYEHKIQELQKGIAAFIFYFDEEIIQNKSLNANL